MTWRAIPAGPNTLALNDGGGEGDQAQEAEVEGSVPGGGEYAGGGTVFSAPVAGADTRPFPSST